MHRPTTSDHQPAQSRPTRPEFALIHDVRDQELDTTASRQLRRGEDFLDAAHHMITSGYHPKAGPTTLRLARLFAARMRTSRDGHFAFAVDATARALKVSRRTVMYAARALRELGLIAYIEHGTKTNVLRTKGTWSPGDGYRGTATLFAALAPPAYDAAHGRRLAGHGYHARIIGVTPHGRARAVAEARRRATTAARCTPSVVVTTDHLQQQVDEGKNNTARTRTPRKTPTSPRPTHPHITPARCAHNIAVAEQIQREIWWLHRTCPRKLAYALRPLLHAGWTAHSLTAELQTWAVPGNLRTTIAYVHHELARRQRTHELPPTTPTTACTTPTDENAERYAAFLRSLNGTTSSAWQHYETQLRPALRKALAAGRTPSRRPAPAGAPVLREPEAVFQQSLPVADEVSVLEVYHRRVHGGGVPRQGASSEGWMDALRDQQAAERAFAALRAELEDQVGPVVGGTEGGIAGGMHAGIHRGAHGGPKGGAEGGTPLSERWAISAAQGRWAGRQRPPTSLLSR
ncbi:hypothetical protein ACFXPZ_17925 [Streptomyces sp. NPDC059101]|uniref:hypothetical protein n=1 Tax=Streptomyces sp. NPDC059101 TaxID=3346728 RepID=UPI0036789B5B